MTELAERSSFSIWLQAIRPFSFTASLVPVIVGASLAMLHPGTITWMLYPLIIVCSLLMHSATNLVSDYFDFKKGVDKLATYGSSRVLVENIMQPRQLIVAGLLLFLCAFILGLIMVAARGLPVLWLGIIGILGGYFYCGGGKAAYKYIAIADPLVFLLMGPLMVCGSYYVLSGSMNNDIIYSSLPIGCLVAAILVANNIRDINDDKAAGTKTLATILGPRGAKSEYVFLVSAAYLIVIILVLMRTLSPWTLLVGLSIPPAVKNINSVIKSDPIGAAHEIATIDIRTAQHHFLFGMLLAVGVIISKWL